MARMKFFRNLLIFFIFIFIFVTYMSEQFIRSTYDSISANQIISDSPKIEIIEAKSTNINGFVKAKITNNTENEIDNQYIKLDFFSKHDNNLGTKYLKVDNLSVNEVKEFIVQHKYHGVRRVEGTVITEATALELKSFTYTLSDTDKLALFVGGLIVTYHLPARYLFGLWPF